MRVAITGARGFVGRWLVAELAAHGHEPVAMPRGSDIRDSPSIGAWLDEARPDAVAHLAAVSFGPDARARPEEAFAINVGGTIALLEAIRRRRPAPAVLVSGSSEVYGTPDPDDLPLSETGRLAPNGPYGMSKVAQESVALTLGRRYDAAVCVTRSFNHIGPGQRPEFVVPALTQRLLAVRDGTADHVPAGNLDVRRDLTDVRDVVVAYRLLLEALASGDIATGGIYNIASGRSVAIREVLRRLAAAIGVEPMIVVDPALVRAGDAPDIRGDATAIARAVGWRPVIDLDATFADIVADAVSATRS